MFIIMQQLGRAAESEDASSPFIILLLFIFVAKIVVFLVDRDTVSSPGLIRNTLIYSDNVLINVCILFMLCYMITLYGCIIRKIIYLYQMLKIQK